ncbi:hypothetical protein L497_1059 [Bordetella holmesii CDC-H585-BH]|uniref:Uncharacterized protein n=1 Tax=Bordetella holmesii CDC-H585-BH TaxID=1331206 RepID=A0A158M7X4_9BORD|nr:hypothetical protein L497_1059 [Bordetella holmesii CDC-H585-BH]
MLLAVARISGETAPLLFTALSNQFMSWNMNPWPTCQPIRNVNMSIRENKVTAFIGPSGWQATFPKAKSSWTAKTC